MKQIFKAILALPSPSEKKRFSRAPMDTVRLWLLSYHAKIHGKVDLKIRLIANRNSNHKKRMG